MLSLASVKRALESARIVELAAGFGLIRVGIQGKNFEILYIFYVACSICLYTIRKRSVLINDMRVSENCIDLNS